MDNALKEQLVHALHRFKRVGMTFPTGLDIRTGELFIMSRIAQKESRPDKNVYVSDIQNNLYVTKPAVSQTLNALEKKGYISREMDKNDRRKVAVTLTAEGEKALEQTKECTSKMLEMIISRLGEENVQKLIELITLTADIAEDLKQETSQGEKKGDHNLD